MEENQAKVKKDILVRLNRIEGQVKGVERMIENNSGCREVLVQLAAIRAALNKVGCLIIENSARDCIFCEEGEGSQEEKLNELVSTLTMFLK